MTEDVGARPEIVKTGNLYIDSLRSAITSPEQGGEGTIKDEKMIVLVNIAMSPRYQNSGKLTELSYKMDDLLESNPSLQSEWNKATYHLEQEISRLKDIESKQASAPIPITTSSSDNEVARLLREQADREQKRQEEQSKVQEISKINARVKELYIEITGSLGRVNALESEYNDNSLFLEITRIKTRIEKCKDDSAQAEVDSSNPLKDLTNSLRVANESLTAINEEKNNTKILEERAEEVKKGEIKKRNLENAKKLSRETQQLSDEIQRTCTLEIKKTIDESSAIATKLGETTKVAEAAGLMIKDINLWNEAQGYKDSLVTIESQLGVSTIDNQSILDRTKEVVDLGGKAKETKAKTETLKKEAEKLKKELEEMATERELLDKDKREQWIWEKVNEIQLGTVVVADTRLEENPHRWIDDVAKWTTALEKLGQKYPQERENIRKSSEKLLALASFAANTKAMILSTGSFSTYALAIACRKAEITDAVDQMPQLPNEKKTELLLNEPLIRACYSKYFVGDIGITPESGITPGSNKLYKVKFDVNLRRDIIDVNVALASTLYSYLTDESKGGLYKYIEDVVVKDPMFIGVPDAEIIAKSAADLWLATSYTVWSHAVSYEAERNGVKKFIKPIKDYGGCPFSVFYDTEFLQEVVNRQATKERSDLLGKLRLAFKPVDIIKKFRSEGRIQEAEIIEKVIQYPDALNGLKPAYRLNSAIWEVNGGTQAENLAKLDREKLGKFDTGVAKLINQVYGGASEGASQVEIVLRKQMATLCLTRAVCVTLEAAVRELGNEGRSFLDLSKEYFPDVFNQLRVSKMRGEGLFWRGIREKYGLNIYLDGPLSSEIGKVTDRIDFLVTSAGSLLEYVGKQVNEGWGDAKKATKR